MHKLTRSTLICLFLSPAGAFATGAGATASDGGATGPIGDALVEMLQKRGENNDHGNSFSTATPVALSSSTSGEIDPGDDADYFRFEVSCRIPVVLESTGSLNTGGILFDARGNRIDGDGASSPNFRIERTLDEGTYYIQVQSFGVETGSYTLHLRRGEGIENDGSGGFDDHGDTHATATRVTLPSTTYGRLDPEDDTDYFRFEVPASGTVVVQTIGAAGRRTLFDARGCIIVQEDDGGLIERELDEGTHYLRVVGLDYGIVWDGYYTLHLRATKETMEEEDDHGNTRSTATPIALPSATSGRIDADDNWDFFRFEVPASGGTVVVETSSGSDVGGLLLDAEGTQLLSMRPGWYSSDFRVEQSLDEGTYYIVVSAGGASGYMLHLHLRGGGDDDHGETRSTATHIALPSFASGGIGPPEGDKDYFRFDVSASETIAIEVIEKWNANNLAATVFDAMGGEIEEDKRGSSTITLTLGEGTYYVQIRRESDSGSGAYKLDLRSGSKGDGGGVGRWDDHGNTRSTATLVALPGQMSGTIDSWNDADYFRFEVRQRGTVTMESYNYDDVDTVGTLFDANGSHITQDDDGGGNIFDFRIERTLDKGTYYVRVDSYGPTAGDYTFYLQGGGSDDDGGGWDAHGDTRSTATHVTLPDIVPGTIDPGNDIDYFRFHLSARGTVVVESSDDLDTVGTLFDANGNYIVQDDNGTVGTVGANFRIERSLPEGMYYVRVHSRGRTTGGYHLVLHGGDGGGNRSDDHGDTLSTATGVALPSTTAGRIDPGNDRDYFRFEVPTSGPAVVESLGGGDMIGTLFDASGNRIAQDDDGGEWLNFRIERTLDEGTYFIRVNSFWATTGGYRLALRGGDDQSTSGETFRDCTQCPAMVPVPAGRFLMGASVSEPHSRSVEHPRRTASVPSFAVGAYEVTFAEWDACVADGGCGGYWPDDAGWGRGDRPVINVSWEDAQLYLEWLSRVSGQEYRLPTEVEWEYAARAGTNTPFYTGGTISPQQANYDGRHDYPEGYNNGGLYREQTVPVGSFAANTLGLHDIHGNVAELVQDCYGRHQDMPVDGRTWEGGDCNDRVLRGGAWRHGPQEIRSAYRNGTDSRDRFNFMGFRVVRTLTP